MRQNEAMTRTSARSLPRIACGILAAAAVWTLVMQAGAHASTSSRGDTMTASSAGPQRVFISGHSLTERPFPDYLEAIARAAGAPFSWDRQYREGSTIQQRTRGGPDIAGWEGYRSGVDRNGKPVDVVALLRNPPDGRAFDTLVITERNSLLSEVLWYDSVRSLRHFVQTFAASSPDGQAYFYEPWHAIDLDDPRSWIAYEKAASPAWACIVSAVNASFAARGDERRIVSVPIAYGLAQLVERALASPGLPGLPAGGERRVLDALFTDNVHPRPIVAYYNALLFYAHVWGRSPIGVWAPEDVDPALVRTLQDVAAEAVEAQRDVGRNRSRAMQVHDLVVSVDFLALHERRLAP